MPNCKFFFRFPASIVMLTTVTQRFLIEPGDGEVRLEHNTEAQTDEFHERPQTPDFVPKKTGVDVSTQIESSDKVFDFDLEVQPLLAVLVGKV